MRTAAPPPGRAAAISIATACGKSDRILGEGHEAEAALGKPLRRFSRAALDARHDAVAAAGGKDPLHRGNMLGLFLVEVGRQAETECQIGGTDIDAVEPGRARDLVDPLHALARLDHDEAQDLSAQHGEITTLHHHCGAHRPVGAPAFGKIAAGGNSRRGLGAIADHGNDDALHPGVERLADEPRLAGGHAGERHRAAPLDRAQHGEHLRVIDETMLLVDADIVHARHAHELGGEGAGQRRPHAEHGLVLGPFFAQHGRGAHRVISYQQGVARRR